MHAAAVDVVVAGDVAAAAVGDFAAADPFGAETGAAGGVAAVD